MAYAKKNFLESLNGHRPDHIPFWFMRQAGRYLPEYRELRAKAGSFLDMAYNPSYASEVTLQPIRRYGMDAAIIFSDILVIPHALGQHLDFIQGEGPKLDAIKDASALGRLNFSKFESTLSPVYEALQKTKAGLQVEGHHGTALIGFCGAPWTVACYMVEGGGSRDFIDVKKFAYTDPVGFAELIDLLVEASAAYLINQINAGAEAVQIFDSWAGALDSQSFRKWVIEPTRKIVELVRDSHPDVPIIGFPRCAGANYLNYIQDTGVTAVGLDTSVDTRWAARTLQPMVPVQGNLDPICLLAGGDALILAAEKIIGDLKGGNFVFNLGHGINKDTPPEHVEQLVNFIRDYKL
ncbi:MAG: uroporphyrinogen decarboxylase [Alphaproteobacteria bacterium]